MKVCEICRFAKNALGKYECSKQEYKFNYFFHNIFIKRLSKLSFHRLLYYVWSQGDGPPPFCWRGAAKHKRKLLPPPRIVDQCCELGLCHAEVWYFIRKHSKHFLIQTDLQTSLVSLKGRIDSCGAPRGSQNMESHISNNILRSWQFFCLFLFLTITKNAN
jgi:hypothetical protein